MSQDSQKSIRIRIGCIQYALIFLLVGLGVKAADIQLLQGEALAKRAENAQTKNLMIQGDRGEILDRNQGKLGTSIDTIMVTADPSQVAAPGKTARAMAKILGMSRNQLIPKLSGNKRYALIHANVTLDQARRLKKLGITGIYFKRNSLRSYPNRDLAAQVIGFTGNGNTGREGLEYQYNDQLKGKKKQLRLKKDAHGGILDIQGKKQPELQGNSLVLTLDKKIQFLTERALEKAVRENKGNSGMAIVMEPHSGELLALAHYPRFNPNNYTYRDQNRVRNRAVTDVFEPGSAMKIFTASAALEKGIGPDSIFNCENGQYKVGREIIRDTHPHHWLNLTQIIQFSSNIGTAKIAETIGKKNLHLYLTRFGFGKKTGISCPGETAGILMPPARWTPIDTDAISFGQGISVSAIQLAAGLSAIANNGILMKPTLVKKILANDGRPLKVCAPVSMGRVISAATAQRVKEMMNLVVEDGTGTNAQMAGYKVCGKTGTAQKTGRGKRGYLKGKYTAVFAGFAPMDHPRLATVVVVDEPRTKYYVGDVAAPAFKSIMAQSFNYLNIPPESHPSMVATLTRGKDQ